MRKWAKDDFERTCFTGLQLPISNYLPCGTVQEDLGLLIDHLIEQINQESEEQPGYRRKKISPNARNILLNHDWPGNIRELQNTLRRAMVWTDGEILKKQDMEEALLPIYDKGGEDILNRPLDGEF